jgi:hypothetical protein
MIDDPAARISALEEILTEKGIIDADRRAHHLYFETRVGPMVGASSRVRGSARRLRTAARKRDAGDRRAWDRRPAVGHLVALDNTAGSTTSSCARCARAARGRYSVCRQPGQVAELPQPGIREHTKVLAEMGYAAAGGRDQGLGQNHLRPWSCPSGRPAHALDEEALARLVTRDSMIGKACQLQPPRPRVFAR